MESQQKYGGRIVFIAMMVRKGGDRGSDEGIFRLPIFSTFCLYGEYKNSKDGPATRRGG
jgi:hypothetical protein